jgi:hypothetical protein
MFCKSLSHINQTRTDKGQKKKDERNKGIVRSHINQTRTDNGQKKKDERNKGIVRSHINQTRTDNFVFVYPRFSYQIM